MIGLRPSRSDSRDAGIVVRTVVMATTTIIVNWTPAASVCSRWWTCLR